MTLLVVSAIAPTAALGLGVEVTGVRVEAGTRPDSLGASVAATARVDAPVVDAPVEVSAGAAVSLSAPAVDAQVSATVKTPVVEVGVGARVPPLRPPADPSPLRPPADPSPQRPESAPAAQPPPSVRRPPVTARSAPHSPSPNGFAEATGPFLTASAQPSAASAAEGSEGSTTRGTLRAVAAAAARGLVALLALLAAFGLYLAVQRRLDQGPRMAWTGNKRHPPDDEMLYF